jgi:hypothetical protein
MGDSLTVMPAAFESLLNTFSLAAILIQGNRICTRLAH